MVGIRLTNVFDEVEGPPEPLRQDKVYTDFEVTGPVRVLPVMPRPCKSRPLPEMAHAVALVTLQCSVEVLPLRTSAGSA